MTEAPGLSDLFPDTVLALPAWGGDQESAQLLPALSACPRLFSRCKAGAACSEHPCIPATLLLTLCVVSLKQEQTGFVML